MDNKNNTELHYPDLANCTIETTSGTALTNESIVKLPQDCLAASRKHVPPLYGFSVERSIIRKKKERGQNGSGDSSSSSDEVQTTSAHSSSHGSNSAPSADKNGIAADEADLEKSILVKMKSVTGADDAVCVALLKQNSYDLEASIETFFQSNMR